MQSSIDIQLRAVVFDWDLTLWNSWDIHMALMNQTAEALGYPQPTTADLGVEYSRPFLEHLAWFFPGDQEIVLETYMSYYHAVVWQEQRLYPGILELIKRFKDKAYRTAILSDKRQDFGVPEFESSGLGGLIDRSVFFADGMLPKPDPAGLQDVMESLEVSPEECLFIGDSYRDIECAKRAGAWSGAALWASVEPELVITLQPEFLWNKVGDVAVTLNLE
ncbi:MAG: HAD family hydrolase [Chloroflexota bacterium]|nr:HAD family hydrolase [Chloroflexota bacterium]MEC9447476.1 HAD family hydrolase [Chloroflexota bacterium]MEE3247858.1 HAD family hydrolase [Chloroflexota bacterium]MEE3250119.1 HAD family hydrolase [Chloroflexota bacterium]|tara:strand:+ start:2434 stop:3093 length:660 start_codon:yes stop_codon:yes gene_type:complete